MPESTPFDPALLEEQGLFLRRMARALTADPHLQDDLVQEAWVAALEKPPRSGERIRGWLRTVAVNCARMRWRGEGRRVARERAAAREEALPDTAWTVERRELLGSLTGAVTTLEEPFRTAVLHRYFDGLPPREIARLTGAPVETVRTRLKRALVLLRDALDRKHDGDRRAWTAPMAVLAALPAKEAGAVALAAGGTAAGALVPGAAIGALIVKKCVVPVCVVVLVVAGWLVVEGMAGGDPPPVPPPGETTKAASPPPAGERVDLPLDKERVSLTPPKPAPETRVDPGDLVVRVVDTGGRPLGGIPTRIVTAKGGKRVVTKYTAVSNQQQGLAVYRGFQTTLARLTRPADVWKGLTWSVALDMPLATPREVVFDPQALPGKVVELVKPPTGSLVVDCNARVAECEVGLAVLPATEVPDNRLGRLLHFFRPYPRPEPKAIRFPYVGLGLRLAACLVKRKAPGNYEDCWILESSTVRGWGPREAGGEATLLLHWTGRPATRRPKEPGSPITLVAGRVVDGEGRPVSDSQVTVFDQRVHMRDYHGKVHYSGKRLGSCRTDAQGRFQFKGQAHHDRLLVDATARGLCPALGVEVARGAEGVRLVLLAGGTIKGSLLLPEGVGPRVVSVTCQKRPEGDYGRLGRLRRDGSFSLSPLRPGTYAVQVRLGRGIVEEIEGIRVKARQTTEDPRLTGIDLRDRFHPLTVRVKDEKGAWLPKAELLWGDGFNRSKTVCREEIKTVGGKMRVFARAEATLVLPSPQADVIVKAMGYRPRKLLGLSGTVTVILQPAPRIRLQLDRMPSLPLPNLRLQVNLERIASPATGDGENEWTNRAYTLNYLDFSDANVLGRFVDMPGRYRVRWVLSRYLDRWNVRRLPLPRSLQTTIEVEDTPKEQVFRLTVPVAEITRLARERYGRGG